MPNTPNNIETFPKDIHSAKSGIAEFLQDFNEIEAQTYLLLSHMPAEDELVSHASKIQSFKSRARYIQALLRSSEWKNKDEIYSLLTEAITLADYRNRLSHAPLRIGILKELDNDDWILAPVLHDSKKGNSITLDNLYKNVEAVKKVSMALIENVIALRLEEEQS